MDDKYYIRYYELPYLPYGRIEFGFWNRDFARKVFNKLPTEWKVAELMNKSKRGCLYVNVYRRKGLFWDLIKIVESMSPDKPVSMIQKLTPDDDKLIFSRLIRMEGTNN